MGIGGYLGDPSGTLQDYGTSILIWGGVGAVGEVIGGLRGGGGSGGVTQGAAGTAGQGGALARPPDLSTARSQLQAITDALNSRLAANLELATKHLTQAEVRAACSDPRVARMLYGRALEKMVADFIESSKSFRQRFRHLGGPNQPDFVGVGEFEGMTFDITTAGQIGPHQARPYGPAMDIITYERPSTFP